MRQDNQVWQQDYYQVQGCSRRKFCIEDWIRASVETDSSLGKSEKLHGWKFDYWWSKTWEGWKRNSESEERDSDSKSWKSRLVRKIEDHSVWVRSETSFAKQDEHWFEDSYKHLV